ncbi:hypothetical protein CFOL_v3_03517, partial [Cephalotus follicularis]
PNMVGKSRRVVFQIIKDRVWSKLQRWKKLLSKAGREILIKAAAQTIPTYAMSVFQLPYSLCTELNSMVSNFWRGQQSGENKIHWISWNKLCRPKLKGYLGFRNLKAVNIAMLAK